MKERRKRLLQSLYQKERGDRNLPLLEVSQGNDYQADFLKEFQAKEAQKNVIIQGFSAVQLEEMLRTSTRNVAYEVISCLIENGRGVLTEIIKFLSTTTNRHFVQEENSFFLDSLQKKNSYGNHYNAQLYPRPNIKSQGTSDSLYIKKQEGESGEEEETDSYTPNQAISKLGKKNPSNLSLGSNYTGDEGLMKLRKQSVETSQTNLHLNQGS